MGVGLTIVTDSVVGTPETWGLLVKELADMWAFGSVVELVAQDLVFLNESFHLHFVPHHPLWQ